MRAVLFLHLLGAVGMGYYLVFPFLLQRLKHLKPASQAGYVAGLSIVNRIGQFLLILQFITGGYLIGKGDYSVLWMVLTFLFFLLVGAFTGMMGGPLKRLQSQLLEGKTSQRDSDRVRLYSWLTWLFLLVVLLLMNFPDWF